MTLQGSIDETTTRTSFAESPGDRAALSQEAFRRMIVIERKRTERSGKPFLLMLLDAGNRSESERRRKALDAMLSALQLATRETDVIGWYTDQTVVGAIFTGLVVDDKASILNTILTRVSTTLRDKLTFEQFNQVNISFHFFPDDWDEDHLSGHSNSNVLYPDLHQAGQKQSLLNIKRLMDVAGSLLALIVFSPLLLLIALAVKLSSSGPVFFRQQRVGQYGKCFTFLKFRSMYTNNDHSVHREYVTKMIIGDTAEPLHGNGEKVYKITNDKRVTRVGKFLRRSSLDELPQFLNVLKGDMSLVGPRPAIPYEVASYQTWHRLRVLEVKPGITGLWQVNGRNRIKFDEMVRLDLQYAKVWSPWLDIKILIRTPGAVFKGAY